MNQREVSYWLSVLVGGPLAGIVAGILWTVWMGLLMGPSIAHWICPGAGFTAWMMLMFSAMYAITFRHIRREWRVGGDDAARQRLLSEAARMKYHFVSAEGNYLVLRPKRFGIKPLCANVEVWLTNDTVVVDGPYAVVNKLAKRLNKP